MQQEVVQAVQKQINHERQNAQKYLYMGAGFENMAYSVSQSFSFRKLKAKWVMFIRWLLC